MDFGIEFTTRLHWLCIVIHKVVHNYLQDVYMTGRVGRRGGMGMEIGLVTKPTLSSPKEKKSDFTV